jgi:hypothetical protein
MSSQGETWLRHTKAYLKGAGGDALVAVFERAMGQAGYPESAPADCLEAMCADFLSGFPCPKHTVEQSTTQPT